MEIRKCWEENAAQKKRRAEEGLFVRRLEHRSRQSQISKKTRRNSFLSFLWENYRLLLRNLLEMF